MGLKSLVNKSAGAVGKVVTKGTGAVGKAVTKGTKQIGKTLNAIADSPDKQVIEDPETAVTVLEAGQAQRSIGTISMGFDDIGTQESVAFGKLHLLLTLFRCLLSTSMQEGLE